MGDRVRDLEMHVVKLAKLAGLEGETQDKQKVRVYDQSEVGCVTADLEVEALTRAFVESLRELDIMLVSLLEVKRPAALQVREDIDTLTKDLAEKSQLIGKTKNFLSRSLNSLGR